MLVIKIVKVMIHKILRMLGFCVHYTAQILMAFYFIYFIIMHSIDPVFGVIDLAFGYTILFLQDRYVRGTKQMKIIRMSKSK